MRTNPAPQSKPAQAKSLPADATIAEIVDLHPETMAVFAAHRIDLCCGGKLSLATVAERHRISLASLLAELERALTGHR